MLKNKLILTELAKLNMNPIFSLMNEWNLKKTILDKKLRIKSLMVVLIYIFAIVLISNLFFLNYFSFHQLLPVSKESISNYGQYYRLFSATFIHADYEHLGSNLLLFFPFSLYLYNTFGFLFFPLSAFFAGALINFLTIQFMPDKTELIGLSGVVYYVGFLWITLYFLNNRKLSTLKRFIKATGVALILFFPTMIRVEVSYLSHFFGSIVGVFTAFISFYIFREKWKSQDEYEMITDEFNFEVATIESENQITEREILH